MTASRFAIAAILFLVVAVAEITGGCSAYQGDATCCYGVGCCANDQTYCCPANYLVCCGNHTDCCPSGYYCCCQNNTKCCKYSKSTGTMMVEAKQGGVTKASR